MREDDGSALLLAPVLALIAAVCLALVAETAITYVIWSRLTNAAATCSLVAAQAVDVTAYETTGAVSLDQGLAAAKAASCVESLTPGSSLALGWPGPRSVTVTITDPAPRGLATWLGLAAPLIHAHATATLAPTSLERHPPAF